MPFKSMLPLRNLKAIQDSPDIVFEADGSYWLA